ncbi:hypothetical protein COOONC_11249 [Cooperia oncophora]
MLQTIPLPLPGNSRLRPHWLPDSRDSNDCHEKLRNDYIILERMEEQLDQELLTCLLQNSAQGNPESSCDMNAYRSASIFAFGRSIIRTPVNCFSGVTKRIERECGQVKSCCPGVSSCSSIPTTSPLATSINDMKAKMRQRAADCDKGLPISKSPLPQCTTSSIEAGSSQPNRVMPPTVSANNGTNNNKTGEGQASVAEGERTVLKEVLKVEAFENLELGMAGTML